ncbi:MAG: prolyl oligopeptidase family serine peptidase [Prevotella sp.]|nr:prolyl oligopeptidase family serine peptidase [Prevotella sp.]
MRNHFLFFLSFVTLPILAQGTLDDYNRAYSLYGKFNSSNVYHWAQDVQWYDSTHVVRYSIYTPEGRRFVMYDLDKGERQMFESEKERDEALRQAYPTQRKDDQHPAWGRGRPTFRDTPFRQKERHWMEVDEENEPKMVTSPDAKWDVWVEGYNIVLHQAGKPFSEKRVLTQDGTIGNYYSNRILWSPDSRKFFVCKRRAVEKRYAYYVESSPKDQLQPILHKQEYAKPGDELPQRIPNIFVLEGDTAKGLAGIDVRQIVADTALCPRQYDLEWFRWTDDSREVTMEYNQRGHKVYRLLAMDAQTGRLRTMIEEHSDKFVNYNRTYRHWFSANEKNRDKLNQIGGKRKKKTPSTDYLLWMSERDNWSHLYLYDVSPNASSSTSSLSPIVQVTKGNWCVREVLRVDEDDMRVYFTASGVNPQEDPYLIHYYSIKMDGTDMRCLTPGEGNHRAHFSRDHQFLVDTYSQVDKAPVTVIRRVIDGSLMETLECADLSKITDDGWVAPEVFTAKGRDGVTDIWGIIQRPTNFDPNKKYPIIEYIYAGPGDAYTPKSFNPYNWNMTPLAELGFIVVQLDGMGTSWRGKQFEEVCYKNLKDAGFPDRKAWIRAAAAKYPYMDADNVGIFGASAGGQESTTAVLLHGDFYKAAYSSCGCHDNRMDKIWWNEQWMGYPVDSSYVECSNVYHASKLERPLMLVVGELDDNVDPASTMQVADALIRANKDFELVVLPGVHHTMGERYGEHKRFDFFVKHLLHVTPPKWDEVRQ